MFYVTLHSKEGRIKPGYEESDFQGLIGYSDIGRAEDAWRAHLSIMNEGERVTLFDTEKNRVIRKKEKGYGHADSYRG